MIRKTINDTYIVSADELEIKHTYGKEACSTCPLCRDSREHPGDPSLKVDITTGAGYCHHCHEKIFVPDFSKTVRVIPRIQKPVYRRCVTDGITSLDEVCTDFIERRNIDPRVAARAGVGSCVMHGVHYLAFPFIENGVAVNVQYKRADANKKEFKFFPGGKIVPWNIDCVMHGNGKTPLYITEGMMDAIAMMQSGYSDVVSVPNGSGSNMEVFDNYREVIKQNFSHIVFAGDNDKVGEELRDRVKEYFKDMEVSVVTWHWSDYKCKDANGMLLCGNAEAVAFSVENAKFDECGFFDVMDSDDAEMMRVYQEGMPEGKGVGLKSLDSLMKFLCGYVYLFSGSPGTGKSSFVNFIAMSLLKNYGWRTLFFSPEKMPKTNHRIELVSVVTGKKYDKNVLCEGSLHKAMEFLSGNVIQMRDDIDRDIDVILHAAEIAIRRHGIKVMVIDPFMYIDMKRLNGMSETTKIKQMLTKVRLFAQKHSIVVIVVAHPRKPNTNAERPGIFEMLYEVSGSTGFFDFCDVGIMLERADEKTSKVNIKCGKARFSYLGRIGQTSLIFNPENGRYSECSQFGTPIAPDFTDWTSDKVFYKKEGASDYVCNKPF